MAQLLWSSCFEIQALEERWILKMWLKKNIPCLLNRKIGSAALKKIRNASTLYAFEAICLDE